MIEISRLTSLSQVPQLLKEMLNDCRRFLLRFNEVISHSSLHIYYSALPFVPTSTKLCQKFKHRGMHHCMSTVADAASLQDIQMVRGPSNSGFFTNNLGAVLCWLPNDLPVSHTKSYDFTSTAMSAVIGTTDGRLVLLDFSRCSVE
jgi:hypothetical protein